MSLPPSMRRSATVASAVVVTFLLSSGIGRLLCGASRLQLLQVFGLGDDVQQRLVEGVVAVELGEQIIQAAARIGQLAQRVDVEDEVSRGEVVQALEGELH